MRLSQTFDKYSHSKLIITPIYFVPKSYQTLRKENSIFSMMARRSFSQVIHNAFLVAFYVLLGT